MRTFFPDTTVLINFTLIERVAMLGQMIPDLSWCEAVHGEWHTRTQSEQVVKEANAAFGDPLHPEPAERVDTLVIRNQMSKPGDGRTAHIGEAETIAIIDRRHITAVFATDDIEAGRVAKDYGIEVVTTWQLIRVAVKSKHMTEDEAWHDCCVLSVEGRGWPPCKRDRPAFDTWLNK